MKNLFVYLCILISLAIKSSPLLAQTNFYTPTPAPTLSEQELVSLAKESVEKYYFFNGEKIQNYNDYEKGVLNGRLNGLNDIEKAISLNKAKEIIFKDFIKNINSDVENKLKTRVENLAQEKIDSQLKTIYKNQAGSIQEISNCESIYNIDEMKLHLMKSKSYVSPTPFVKQELNLVNFSDAKISYSDMINNAKYYLSPTDLKLLNENPSYGTTFSSYFVSFYKTHYDNLIVRSQSDHFKAGQYNAKIDLLNEQFKIDFKESYNLTFTEMLYNKYSLLKSELCSNFTSFYNSKKYAAERAKIDILNSSIIQNESTLEEIVVNVEIQNVGLGAENKIQFHFKDNLNATLISISKDDCIEPFQKRNYELHFKFKSSIGKKLITLGDNKFIIESQTFFSKSNKNITFKYTESDLISEIEHNTKVEILLDLSDLILNNVASEWNKKAENITTSRNFYKSNSSIMRKIYIASKSHSRGYLKGVFTSTENSNFNAALTDIKSNEKFSIFHPFDYKKAQDFLVMFNELVE